MADTKISALGAASALVGTEPFPTVQAATTVQATAAQIKTYALTSPSITGNGSVAGNLTVGSGVTGVVVQPIAAGGFLGSAFALYTQGLTYGSSNYTLASASTLGVTYLNSIGTTVISVNAIPIVSATSTGAAVTGTLSSTGVAKLSNGYTVATLPAGAVGQHAYVTDALAPTFLGTLTGGGAVVTPVFHNGTAWVAN
jgi:hypothetical protein